MGLSPLTESTQNLGKYALIEKIGEGHLGLVYRGFDQDLGTPVAIRILCDGITWDSKLEEMFKQETRVIAGLQHPNIAAMLEIGREGSIHYIAMESLGSETLENLIAQNSAISVETKLSIMIHVSEGLSHAHKHGILHRDIVPGKIHLAPNGSAKIRDFALTHILMKHLPHPAVRWGSPIYLCPEQIQQRGYDARSDIFSAGTIFYQLLTHVHPFHDRDSNKALDNILSDTPIPTFEKFPDAPPGIWPILRSCLAKNPEERYQSADQISEACRALLVSLAEDKQLILSELYASLSPLRKAAALPNAAASTIALLRDIQSLLRGEKEADYATLDRLMTSLTEEYPSIQTAACAPPDLGSICPQIPPEVQETVRPELTIPSIPPIEAAPPASTSGKDDKFFWSRESPALFAEEPGKAVPQQTCPELRHSSSAELEDPPAMPAKETVEPAKAEAVSIAAEDSPGDQLAGADGVVVPADSTSAANEVGHVPLPPAVSRYLGLPRLSVRATVILLAILGNVVAGFIVLGTDAAAPIRKRWSVVLPFSDRILHVFAPQSQNKATADIPPGAASNQTPIQGKPFEDEGSFSLAHDHGVFGGACRGILSLSATEVTFSPSSGSHGFRIPFKLLKLKTDGKSLSLYYISDDSRFETFEALDYRTAARFSQKWSDLKAVSR